MGFPGGSDGNESACNVGDLGSIPGLGWSPGGGHDNPLQYSCLENPHGQRSLAGYGPQSGKESDTTERLTSVSTFQDWGVELRPLCSPACSRGASGGVTCCTPPLRPPSLPCWGSFAGRRPGTRFAGTRAPIWTGCDASSCWWAQSRRHRTAQAPGSVDWTLERETAADPDCFCLSNFQNSGLSGWILKRERSRFDRVCSLHSADRQTDRQINGQKYPYVSPLSFGGLLLTIGGNTGVGAGWPQAPHCPFLLAPPKPTPFLSLEELKRGWPLFSGQFIIIIISLARWLSDMKQHSESWSLVSRRWVPPSLRSRGKNAKRYSLHLDKMFRGWK